MLFRSFLSTDYGANWTVVNTGLTNKDVRSLAVFGTNIFAGTSNGGVLIRPLSEMVTSVENHSTEIPMNFSLNQNYPNPFNPTTTFKFSLPKSGFVTLKVFNVLGEEVAKLVNKDLGVGTYTTQWDASKFGSGVYYYRLQVTPWRDGATALTGSFVETKKLLLLR